MPTVIKGKFKTNVSDKDVEKYKRDGWKVESEPNQPQAKTYDDYTKKQLKDIGNARGVILKDTLKKSEMIERLLKDDKQQMHTPSNKGFTDNLIK